METITVQDQPCARLRNETIELVVSVGVGPRVVRFARPGGRNPIHHDFAAPALATGWHMRGGHRLWHAPEAMPRTYQPDNAPVTVSPLPGGWRFSAPAETATGLQKELDIFLHPAAAQARLVHRLTNHTLWPVEVAAWALTVMAQGGTAFIPLPPKRGHSADTLLPTFNLALWSYTDLTDPRWRWGQTTIQLRQDPNRHQAQKLGAWVEAGWVAYQLAEVVFVKYFEARPQVTYPDRGCNFETYTDGGILELETLGPLTTLPPGGALEHVEHWQLLEDLPPLTDEATLARELLPRLVQW